MKKENIIIIVLLIVLGISTFSSPVKKSLGSVGQTGEYQSTTTVGMTAGTHRIIQTGQSTLGSVIIASSSGTTFTVWNATSTTDSASTTIGAFVASAGNGTYTFDSVAQRGIIVALPTNFNGSYIITTR